MLSCFLPYTSSHLLARNKLEWFLSLFMLLRFPFLVIYSKCQLKSLNYNILNILEQLINFTCGHSTGSLTWKGKAGSDIKPSKYVFQYYLLPFFLQHTKLFIIAIGYDEPLAFFFFKSHDYSEEKVPIW